MNISDVLIDLNGGRGGGGDRGGGGGDGGGEPKSISQGSYGCIYYPGISCSGKSGDTIRRHDSSKGMFDIPSKYISKLQTKNFTSYNELLVGEIIQQIPNYSSFFAPVIKKCDINLAAIDTKYVSKCEVVSKYIDSAASEKRKKTAMSDDRSVSSYVDDNFMIQKIEYIEGMDLRDYLVEGIFNDDDGDDGDASDDDASDVEDDASDDDDDDDGDTNMRTGGKGIGGSLSRPVSYSLKRHIFSVLFDCYYYLQSSFQTLMKNNLVHFDLKYNNVFIKLITGKSPGSTWKLP